MAEFTVKQSDLAQVIQQSVTFDAATNLVGATAQFVYRPPGTTVNIVRSAEIVSSSPSAAAATSATLKRALTISDVATAGVYVFEWKITLSNGTTVIIRPKKAATSDYPDRAHQAFEVVPSLSPSSEASTEDPAAFITRSIIVVNNLTELRALPASSNYFLAIVKSDANGQPGTYWWDASIRTADDDGNLTIALTSNDGGWRRQGL